MFSSSRAFAVAGTVLAAAVLALTSAMAAPGGKASAERVIVAFKAGKGPAVKAALQGLGAELHYEFPALRGYAATIPAAAARGLASNPNVEFVEADARRYPMAQSTPYGITMVQADITPQPGAPQKTVCIIDSGYSAGHEDLPSSNVSGANTNLAWNQDGDGHGTHVAGTVAAVSNSVGVVGVIGNVNLYIVRVFGDSGTWAYSSDLVSALGHCENGGADVVNMSLGGGLKSKFEDRAFSDAFARGLLSIASAGNGGNTRRSYPASYDSVVSVAAVDSARNHADFSQANSAVEIAAPGVTVRSTVPMGTGSSESVAVGSSDYEVVAMEGSPNGSATGPLVNCGLGTSACAGGRDQVCLIQRGDISFADKVLACEAGGGVAAIVYNNLDGLFSGTLGETATTIPSVGMSKADGEALATAGGTATVANFVGHYAFFDGTSMAAPHVSGAAALVWSNHTSCSNSEIRNALNLTAEDLGDAGRDNLYGFGLVQARSAHDYLTANPCGGGSGGGGGGGGGDGGKPCNPNSPKCNP